MTVKIWRMSNYTNVKTLTGHTDWVNSVSYSPDGFIMILLINRIQFSIRIIGWYCKDMEDVRLLE